MKRDSNYTNILLGALGIVWGIASTLAFLTLSQIQEDLRTATNSGHAIALVLERSLEKIENLEKRCCRR